MTNWAWTLLEPDDHRHRLLCSERSRNRRIVGHLRSTIIGDAAARTREHLAYEAIR